jgi:subfamily B ATP-binding cassette protein MsbA
MKDLRDFSGILSRYLRPHWKAVLLLLASSYVATALTGLLPVVMAPILDLALGSPTPTGGPPVGWRGVSLGNLGATVLQRLGLGGDLDRFTAIAVLCGVFVAVGLLKGAFDFWNYMLALWIRVRAGAAMQLDLFRHLFALSLSFFNRQRTGELVSRLDADTRATSAGLETVTCTLLSAPVLIAFYGYLMVRTSPTLVVAALAAAALHLGVTRGIRGPIRRFATDQFTVLADLVARLQEAILSVRVVKSFEAARLTSTLRKVLRVNVKYGAYKHAEEPARTAVGYIVEAGIVLLAARELLAGRLTVATFFLFLYVGRAVVAQMSALAGAYTQIQATLAASTRIAGLFAIEPEVKDGPETVTDFREGIVVRDVSFDYGGERVLEGASFEVRKGEIVALVGPSGVGKSTLADLILRLYDPVAGTITIDGHDLRALRQEPYRRLFGVVPQEPLLFNASIRENIAYGRSDLTEADIVRAAQIANAHGFIGEFTDGYDTIVGDRGVRLSGGQRQRVALARAIVGRPPILLLDEATSSLDSESERLVQQAIERVIQAATSIVIAHRLSTVLHADKIVVMNRGRVEAVGRHADLMTASETYSRLYRYQFNPTELTKELTA